jgi:hypothetical protein
MKSGVFRPFLCAGSWLAIKPKLLYSYGSMDTKEVFYDGSLEGLFAILDRARLSGSAPERILRAVPRPPDRSAGSGQGGGSFQGDLFDSAETSGNPLAASRGSLAAAAPLPAAPVPAPAASGRGVSGNSVPAGAAYFVPSGESAPALFEASADAFDACVLAWMSE